jgi:predicted dehydrogenase
MNSEILKVGVIGAGFIGPLHIESLRRLGGIEVVAVADQNGDLAKKTATSMFIPKSYGDWHDLVADPEVNVIHNCTPNNLHFEINKAILNAGKPVVSEKPLGFSSIESSELLRLSTQLGVPNLVCFTYRGYPAVQQMHAMASSGELGKLWIVSGTYLQDWLWAETDYSWKIDSTICGPSRVMADIGSHFFEISQFITGQNIISVCADFETFYPKRKKNNHNDPSGYESISIHTEDYGSLLLHFSDGMHGSFSASQVSAGRKNYLGIEINGSGSSFAWNNEDAEKLWIGHRDNPNMQMMKDKTIFHEQAQPYCHYPVGHPEGFSSGFKNLFQDFYTYLRSGASWQPHPANFPSFWEGHRSMLVLDAVIESARKHAWVDVDLSSLPLD